ncbi:SPOR domain-containing protein [Paracoccus sp. Z330]|uniref:SPOR domain-containing protein n=1 Tax=Paracoccus onchidii TaxID=3017813 RepID=A0ABT4ZFS0_9RHOB|nr:SPOR domain-containing protein [Paracoccus onchidii]MDB6177818.1 SPOR domain-containing protein [Paracoccus onchidii]
MRFLTMTILVAVLTRTVGAAPVPFPPDDFNGTQYVDRSGCVFRRMDGVWVALKDRAGGAVCGFPPTFQDVVSGTAAPDPQGKLLGQLAAGMKQGEFIVDPRPVEQRAPAVPDQQDGALLQEIEAVTRAQAGQARAGRPSDLCAMLGYAPDKDMKTGLGQDVTMGLCPGMRASSDIQPANKPVKKAAITKAAASEATANGSQIVQDRRSPEKPRSKQSTKEKSSKPAMQKQVKKPEEAVEMIPPTARFVQVGAYEGNENVMIIIRRLSELGYKVAQKRIRQNETDIRIVFAGPFTNRKGLIAALNELRASGYPKAIAR